ncbi:MAG TPA: hypothetical protein V6C57_19700, partial [Coleofasciculaceae cyanobacterium]
MNLNLDKLQQERDRLNAIGGDTSELDRLISDYRNQPTLQPDRERLKRALDQAQVIQAELIHDAPNPIPIRQKAGELAQFESPALAQQPTVDLQLKNLAQQCVELLPPQQKTPDRVARIADMVRHGDRVKLTNLHNALYQNYQISIHNSSTYAPVHAPQTHSYDNRQETTFVYAPR